MNTNSIMSQPFPVVLVADFVYPRVCKIGYGLRSAGWKVVLLHRDHPARFVNDIAMCFDEMHSYGTPQEAVGLAMQMPGALFHVFSVWDFDVAALLIQQRPGKVVFDDWDVMAGMVNDDLAEKNYPGQMTLERYCFENADGVCSRCLEPQYARRHLGYRFKGKPLMLLDSCWGFHDQVTGERSGRDELHVAYVGSINPEKNRPKDVMMYDSYLEFARDLAASQIHFHIYPNPLRCQNYVDDYSEYIDLSLTSPYFHFHQPMSNDRLGALLAQHDVGLMTDYGPKVHARTGNYNERKFDYAASNKVFDYLDAGLGIISGDYRMMTRFLRRTGTGIFSYLEDVKEKLLSEPVSYWKGFRENALRTKDKYSIRKSIPRLIDYYLSVQQGGNITAGKKAMAAAPAGNEKLVKFSFIMIVLNGMPFVEYALKAVYDDAHEIIVVEGAVESCMFAANPDGSSVDGTVEAIRNFPDPHHKIRLIQGRWPEKCEMQDAALAHVTGNYVWLIDSDEIYRKKDLAAIRTILAENPGITQVNFIFENFWKGFDYIFVSPKFFETPQHCRRVFKFKPGARFTTHRPPTMVWPGETRSTEQMLLLDAMTTYKMGLFACHYSYVLDSQVAQKIELYHRYGWGEGWGVDLDRWYHSFFQQWTPENRLDLEAQFPIWTGDPASYSTLFQGEHPEVMSDFIAAFKHDCNLQNGAAQPAQSVPLSPDTPVMFHVIEAIKSIQKSSGTPRLFALETGTIRSYHEKHESTRHLSAALGPLGHLISVDCNPESIRISRDICNDAANVTWVESESIPFLKGSPELRLSFALLDSANDQELIMEEFELVAPMMLPGGIVMVDDAGVRTDKTGFDSTEAEKGRGVWRFLQSCGADYSVLETPHGHGTQLKVVFHAENERIINDALSQRHAATLPPQRKGIKVAGDYEQHQNLTAVNAESEFATSIRELFRRIKPTRIIETGTYWGEGTTRVIAQTLRDCGISDAIFYSIECNPENHRRALANLAGMGLLPYVKPLEGLSVPRHMLPKPEEIEDRLVRNLEYDDIFVDHQQQDRTALYFNETAFDQVPDDMLGACLRSFGYAPDFVLLDSGGHMGNIEFNYLIGQLKAPAVIALDDIYHVKHHKSFLQIQSDPRFELIVSSKEKFGFCIAKFTP